jgi:hypothetical protein
LIVGAYRTPKHLIRPAGRLLALLLLLLLPAGVAAARGRRRWPAG